MPLAFLHASSYSPIKSQRSGVSRSSRVFAFCWQHQRLLGQKLATTAGLQPGLQPSAAAHCLLQRGASFVKGQRASLSGRGHTALPVISSNGDAAIAMVATLDKSAANGSVNGVGPSPTSLVSEAAPKRKPAATRKRKAASTTSVTEAATEAPAVLTPPAELPQPATEGDQLQSAIHQATKGRSRPARKAAAAALPSALDIVLPATAATEPLPAVPPETPTQQPASNKRRPRKPKASSAAGQAVLATADLPEESAPAADLHTAELHSGSPPALKPAAKARRQTKPKAAPAVQQAAPAVAGASNLSTLTGASQQASAAPETPAAAAQPAPKSRRARKPKAVPAADTGFLAAAEQVEPSAAAAAVQASEASASAEPAAKRPRRRKAPAVKAVPAEGVEAVEGAAAPLAAPKRRRRKQTEPGFGEGLCCSPSVLLKLANLTSFEFAALWRPVPSLLLQCHASMQRRCHLLCLLQASWK